MNWIKRKLRDWVAPKHEYWRNRAYQLSRENTELKNDIFKLVMKPTRLDADETEAKWAYKFSQEDVFLFGSFKAKELLSDAGIATMVSNDLFDKTEE